MAAATSEALLERAAGASVVTAYPQVTPNGVGPQDLDLIKICDQGDNTVLNVDYAGTVHNPATTVKGGTRIGKFYTRLAAGASTAALFADAFTNPSLLDILQVMNVGGNISYWLDYTGTANGS